MSKEMYISSSPHETKVAVLEDDQLVEVYFERDTDVGLVGGIYKGRVNRVLPGMQSAFVDIGLERDAFLYVSDFFFEDQEEYDKVFEEAEARATKLTAQEAPAAAPAEPADAPAPAEVPVAAPVAAVPPADAPTAVAAPPPPPSNPPEFRDRHGFDSRRGRRRRHRGRPGFEPYRDRKFTPPTESSESPHVFEILPGESLAKYNHAAPPSEETGSALPEGTETSEAGGEPFGSVPDSTAEANVEAAAPVTDLAQEVPAERDSYTPEAGPVPSAASAEIVEAPEVARLELDSVATSEPAAVPESQETTESATETESGALQETTAPESPTSAFSIATPSRQPEPDVAPPAVEFAPPYTPVEKEEEAATEEAVSSEVAPEAASSVSSNEPEDGEPGEEEVAGEAEEAAENPSAAPEGAPGEPPAAEGVPGESGDRTYTLREHQERPRFAPRRRRGRRGQGGGRRDDNRHESSRPGNHQPVQIAEVLKEGQEILVQIAKEPLGTKGARITSHVALPGRYLVYMPTIDHIGVSRKIASEDERLRLRNIILENKGPLTGGFIVRTAGQGRSEDEFKADLKFLGTLWSDIRAKADRMRAPALLHRDLDLVQRLLRDLLTPDFKCVRVDSEIDYERVLDFVNRCQPALVGKVKLYTRDAPLFEEFGLQQEIEKALKPKVWLKSGGYIVINQTEALVAIDVNTGKYVGKTNRLEDTILKTNIDAVNEIVRQVRLRDLGGIIVIDFIDMDERKNRAKVVQALEEALRSDRAPTKVISFHDFGLVAVTRKRVKQSLERTLCEPCSYCNGSGWIRSVNTICNEILAEARKMAKEIDGSVVTLRVNPEVAKALKSREGALLSELESLTKKDVIVKSDASAHQERFEIF